MSERIRKVPVWLFGLVVAGALAFGAQRAMATPAYFTCTLPTNGGTCADHAECVANCNAIYGEDGYVEAICTGDGCCRCLL
jgi:hypothetical protein